MNFRWREFERRSRGLVRSAVDRSSTLRAERKQVRRRIRTQISWTWIVRIGLLLAAVLRFGTETASPAEFVTICGLWTLGMTAYRACELHGSLLSAEAISVWGNSPIPDSRIFLRQTEQFLLRSLWTALDFFVVFVAIAAIQGRPPLVTLTVVLVAAASWFSITGGGLVVLALTPMKGVRTFSTVVLLTALALLVFTKTPSKLVESMALLFTWVPAPALASALLFPSAHPSPISLILPLTLMLALLAAAPLAWRRLFRSYKLPEETLLYACYYANQSTEDSELTQLLRSEAGGVPSALRDGSFQFGLRWQTLGFAERAFAKLLSSRERLVAEFLTAANPCWTPGIKRILLALLLMPSIAWAGQRFLGQFTPLLIMPSAFLLLSAIGGWNGTAVSPGPGLQPPMYAHYPVGFAEMSRVILKVNLLRLCLVAPFVSVAWILFAHLLELKVAFGGLKVVLCWTMLLPVFPLLSITPNTNDTRRFSLYAPASVMAAAVLGAGVAMVLSLELKFIAAAFGVGITISSALLAWYARFFNRTRIDLIPLRPHDT